MRTSRSVRLTLPNAEAFLFAALLSAALFLAGTTARAGDEPAQDPSDVEQPAQIAPDDAEAPSSETPVPEQPSAQVPSSGTPADGAGHVLDRSLFRPDLKPGTEGATPPPSGQESTEGTLGAPSVAPDLASPADRSKMLSELYVQLSKAKDAEAAAPIATNIEALWRVTGSATIDLLISRAQRFTTESNLGLALEILDATVPLAPENAEVWYLRARVHYLRAEYDLALADLKQALDHDPQHYKALEDLGRVYEALGSKQEALDAYRKALQANPFLQDANQGVQFLSREIGSRNL